MIWKVIAVVCVAIAVGAFVACGSGTTSSDSATETCSSGTDVVENISTMIHSPTILSCTTNIADDAPDWIKDNFHCVTVQVCSSTYKFILNDLPPYKTNYYPTAAKQIAFPNPALIDGTSARHQNPNSIATQTITMTIPKSPTYKSSNLTGTQGGLDCDGVTTYGVCMFNNQAAPPDTLATEIATMDNGEGHPQGSGKYHHHTEPYYLTSDDDTLIGVALDGYPVYGKKKQDGTHPTLDADTNTESCTTTEFPDGTYCYHVANGTGVNGYMFGSYFRGVVGTLQ